MGWQKTFVLSQRKKGCHLVTDEVLAQIEPGIKDVEVRVWDLEVETKAQAGVGRDAVSVHQTHVGCADGQRELG
jgi:hypothetical protein